MFLLKTTRNPLSPDFLSTPTPAQGWVLPDSGCSHYNGDKWRLKTISFLGRWFFISVTVKYCWVSSKFEQDLQWGNMELSAIILAFIIISSNCYNSFLTITTFSNRVGERAIHLTKQYRVFISQDCPTMSRTKKQNTKYTFKCRQKSYDKVVISRLKSKF